MNGQRLQAQLSSIPGAWSSVFPGARSRLKLANLTDVAKAKGVAEGANPLRELLLRGKVAYLCMVDPSKAPSYRAALERALAAR